MNRKAIYAGIVDTGIVAAAVTLDASHQAARTLRDECAAGTAGKADYRYVSEQIEQATHALQRAAARLDLQLGASRAK